MFYVCVGGALLSSLFGIFSGVMAIKRKTFELVGGIGIALCVFPIVGLVFMLLYMFGVGVH